ncbi:MAG TPA: hypothetical protein VFX64_01980 [Candidatus Nitrosotalea sp.]|nr:hypothetical protein [Candidatus Nitrosotalea sp.]
MASHDICLCDIHFQGLSRGTFVYSHVPGKYIIVSVALFTFNMTTDSQGHKEPTGLTQQLWSKPIQITVLP